MLSKAAALAPSAGTCLLLSTAAFPVVTAVSDPVVRAYCRTPARGTALGATPGALPGAVRACVGKRAVKAGAHVGDSQRADSQSAC